ncbi:MAG: hypothetical protein MK052_01385 [Alphaproteobacteria bacterium]|nr:hypothetical protein [Alphaproteobacteria bacterium]
MNSPLYRPEKSLYERLTTQWLTLTNFAWFLGAVLVIIMLVLMFKSAKVLGVGQKEYPYELVGVTATQLDSHLNTARAMGSVVFLYDSKCTNCPKEMDSLLNLRAFEKDKQIALFFVSMDDDPVSTMNFLEKQNVPESMITYYASPEDRQFIANSLKRRGSVAVDLTYPHTLLFNSAGKLIVEYKGYVRSQEIMRTLKLYKMQQDIN